METENRTLLIVDDEPETLKGYVEILSPKAQTAARKSSRLKAEEAPAASNETFNLILAETGEQAIDLMKKELQAGRRIAAGFFDVKLGQGLDGLETIRTIKELDRDIYCAVVTAYHDRSVDEINDIFGDDFKEQWDYLNKPFTQGEILQKARQMIAAWNRHRLLASMNQLLMRSERMAGIGQVARGIGHEFGNILMRIMGKADIALMETDPAKMKEHLEVILKASERAKNIVRNLQSLSKSEPHFENAEINKPIQEALSLFSHDLVKVSVKLEQSLQAVPKTRIDTGGLAQVFLNLFINAAHAMPQGGILKVETLTAKNEEGVLGVVAKVSDSGVGIEPAILPKIFDFAFSTKGSSGSGLGLAISQEIIVAHQGKISVKSELGKGTEFQIWIPL
jgi:signal transduction histidine kinase